MRFEIVLNRLIKNFIETDSLVVVTNSLNVIETNRLVETLTKRNETNKFLDNAESVTNLKIENFEIDLNDCLLI